MEPIHPLPLPAIVFLIGKAISLWIPEQLFGETAWLLRPKDLVAAIAVNRLFHSILTPLLWTVYYEPNEMMINLAVFNQHREYRGLYTQVDIDTVEKNSIFFRYLDVSAYRQVRCWRRVGKPQLQCQHLQALRVSPKVGVAWVSRLIKLNPNLQVLDWKREPNQIKAANTLELQKLFPLRQLRYLGLQGWNLQSLFLCHILENNSNHLEEIDLGTCACFIACLIDGPRMNDDWSGLMESSVAKMTKHQVNKAAKLIRGQPLLLPKVKTFHVNSNPYKKNELLHSLLRALPALETLVVDKVDKDNAMGLSQSLREHCPRLRAIKQSGLYREFRGSRFLRVEDAMMLVDACIPGNVTHLSLDLEQIETYIKDTILKQAGGGLEVLELVLRDRNTMNASFTNLGKILVQSKRLKRVWIRNIHVNPVHTFRSVTSELLEGLRCCHELENLTMIGFLGAAEVGVEMDRENGVQGEGEQQQHMATTSTAGDDKVVLVSSFILPPGWLKTNGSFCTPFRHIVPLSSNFLKRKVFEAVAHLPRLREVELNLDLFQKKIVAV